MRRRACAVFVRSDPFQLSVADTTEDVTTFSTGNRDVIKGEGAKSASTVEPIAIVDMACGFLGGSD